MDKLAVTVSGTTIDNAVGSVWYPEHPVAASAKAKERKTLGGIERDLYKLMLRPGRADPPRALYR
jgi:hypothetical protein